MKVVNELFYGWSWIIWGHSQFGFVSGPEKLLLFNFWGFAINFRVSTTTRSPIYLLPAFYLSLVTIPNAGLQTRTRGLGFHLLIFDLSFNLFKNLPDGRSGTD